MFLTAISALVGTVLVTGVLAAGIARHTDHLLTPEQSPNTESTVARLGGLGTERPWFVVTATAVLLALISYPLFDAVMGAAGIAPEFGYWDWSACTGALDR